MATRLIYQAEITHSGLNKYRIVKAASDYELDQKTRAIKALWDEQWSKKTEREAKIKSFEDAMAYAIEQTKHAEDTQSALSTILQTSRAPHGLDFKSLKDFSKFPVPYPSEPNAMSIPTEPKIADSKYNPKPSFFVRFSKKKMLDLKRQNQEAYSKDHYKWVTEKAVIETSNERRKSEFKNACEQWEKEKVDYIRNQADENAKIDDFAHAYTTGDKGAVERYFSLVLEDIELPFSYNQAVELEFDVSSKMLIVDMLLPKIEDIPNLKSVNYVKNKNEFKEILFPESYIKKTYDNVIYTIVLQSLNIIFALSRQYGFIDSVVFNGKINTIDKANGKNIEPYESVSEIV